MALNDAGTQLMKSGNFTEAAEKFIAAVQINETDWMAWSSLGQCLY